MGFHLAQYNIGNLRADQDDPLVADFMNALDKVNAAGDASDGFVWRYEDESGAAVETKLYDNPRTIVNFTVWESIEQLRAFAYQGLHLDYFRRRSEWIEQHEEASAVLWWTVPGEIPAVEEGQTRLDYLRTHGATALAFGFRDAQRFEAITVATDSLVF